MNQEQRWEVIRPEVQRYFQMEPHAWYSDFSNSFIVEYIGGSNWRFLFVFDPNDPKLDKWTWVSKQEPFIGVGDMTENWRHPLIWLMERDEVG